MCEGQKLSNFPIDSEKKIMSNEEDTNSAASSGTCSSLKPQISGPQVSLLELAADNDLVVFRKAINSSAARVDEPEIWFGRVIGTTKMASEQRTATMIASLYGSLEVLGFILLQSPCPEALVNQVCGSDRTTALHCAAAGGSSCAVEIATLLLENGACYDVRDALGRRPLDVLIVNSKTPEIKSTLVGMLSNCKTIHRQPHDKALHVDRCHSRLGLPNGLLIPEEKSFDPTMQSFSSPDSSSPLFSPPSPSSPKSSDGHSPNVSHGNEKGREYPLDASLPDIKNSIYMTDEFRMFSFKVRPCSRAYSHDWTECPFVHPGENARRRDPRRYHYSCVPCPDFRKGVCRRGDTCEYAHGVFECWLHPAQYRTRLCKDGTSCARRVCFFAHTTEELRPLYLSVPSPRDSSPLELRTMSSPPLPQFSPFSPCNASVSTPPLSPSSSTLNSSYGGPWSQPGIPPLHLPGGLHVSRLRAALSARDMPLEDLNEYADFGGVTADFSCISTGTPNSAIAGVGSSFGRMGKFTNLGLNIPPTNLQDLFSPEHVLPVPTAHQKSFHDYSSLSPEFRSFENQVQSINSLLSPRSSQRLSQLQGLAVNQSPLQLSVQKALYNLGSPRPISTRRVDSDVLGSSSVPLSPDIGSGLHNKRASFSLRDGGSWSSRDLSGSISSPFCSDWGSPSGKPDWGVNGHDLGKFEKSASFASHEPTEPDVSWVQSLVKDVRGDADELG